MSIDSISDPGTSGIVDMTTLSARRLLLAPEYLFVAIGLVFGLLFVYASPPWQANDEDRHFYNAYFHATGQNGMRQDGNRVGGDLPANLLQAASSFQGLQFSPTAKLNKSRVEQSALAPLDESRTVFYDNPNHGQDPLAFAPHIAGIWISRFINSNPVHLLWGARIGGLLAYLAIVFAAIRTIPIHKWVLFAIALTPMALYQASSVTYDTLCIALAFLVVALVVRFACRDRPVSTAELVLFFFVAILERYAKEGYFLLPFLFFIVPRKNIGSNAKMVAIFVLICALFFLPRFTWESYLASLGLHGGKALQTDFLFDTGRQLDFYLQRPVEFFSYLWLNILRQSKIWIAGAVGRFGYAYATLPGAVVFVHVLALLGLSLLDSSKVHALSWRQKLVAASVAFGSLALIVVGFFVKGSPVGAHEIFGIQGRYFLPILPVILLLNHVGGFRRGLPEKLKSLCVPLYCACMLGFSLVFINDYFYF